MARQFRLFATIVHVEGRPVAVMGESVSDIKELLDLVRMHDFDDALIDKVTITGGWGEHETATPIETTEVKRDG